MLVVLGQMSPGAFEVGLTAVQAYVLLRKPGMKLAD